MEKILDDVEARIRASNLFDQYGPLLKSNARSIFEEYFSDDLSLSEVAEHAGITRQGVHDSIKRSLAVLEDYEEALHLVAKHEEAERLAMKVSEAAERLHDDHLYDIAKHLEDLI